MQLDNDEIPPLFAAFNLPEVAWPAEKRSVSRQWSASAPAGWVRPSHVPAAAGIGKIGCVDLTQSISPIFKGKSFTAQRMFGPQQS